MRDPRLYEKLSAPRVLKTFEIPGEPSDEQAVKLLIRYIYIRARFLEGKSESPRGNGKVIISIRNIR